MGAGKRLVVVVGGDVISKAVPITSPIFINEPVMFRALAFTKVQEMRSAKSCICWGKL